MQCENKQGSGEWVNKVWGLSVAAEQWRQQARLIRGCGAGMEMRSGKTGGVARETNFHNLNSSMIAIDSCNVSQAAVHVWFHSFTLQLTFICILILAKSSFAFRVTSVISSKSGKKRKKDEIQQWCRIFLMFDYIFFILNSMLHLYTSTLLWSGSEEYVDIFLLVRGKYGGSSS